MLEFINLSLGYLSTAIKPELYGVCALITTGVSLLTFLVCLFLTLVKPVRAYRINLCASLVFSVLNVYFSVCDYVEGGTLFLLFKELLVYLSLIAIGIMLSQGFLYAIYRFKLKKAFKKPAERLTELPPSNVKPFFEDNGSQTDFSGWIDIENLKGIIKELKLKKLDANDLMELEDFEVYLLNFVSRQPNAYERKVLSTRINSLIKKIARYETG